MSLSNALSVALSGLTAASRGTEVVATNLANAMTPGFARRELQLSPQAHASGGGVQIDGVARVIRSAVLALARCCYCPFAWWDPARRWAMQRG